MNGTQDNVIKDNSHTYITLKKIIIEYLRKQNNKYTLVVIFLTVCLKTPPCVLKDYILCQQITRTLFRKLRLYVPKTAPRNRRGQRKRYLKTVKQCENPLLYKNFIFFVLFNQLSFTYFSTLIY